MKIRFAFYKYNGKLHNKAISLWTWLFNPRTPAYSHVEVGFFIGEEWRYFSSTTTGGAKGTRWIGAEDLFKHKERWDVYEIAASSIDERISRANKITGLPYDWLGIAGFATIFGLLNSKCKWYCSETVWYVMMGTWVKRISPRKIWRLFNTLFTMTKINL